MVRKLIVESVAYWATQYHADGFRFDLMGVLDIETMRAIRIALDQQDHSIFLYGEGWTAGPSPLPEAPLLVRELLGQRGPVEQRALVRHAYWRMPEVPTEALWHALEGEERLRDLAGRGPVTGSCERCHRVVRARSRADVDGDTSGPCTACRVEGPRVTRSQGPTGTGFGWEFEERPAPWHPLPVRRATAGVRRWAEDYPETA